MLTRIDHVVIGVPDLDLGIETYTRLGFNVYAGGVHPGRGTHNAISLNEDDYLELLSGRDPDQYRAAAGATGGLIDFIAAGGGLRHVVVASDDLAADVEAMRGRGVDVSGAIEGSRRTANGVELSWRVAALGGQHPLPVVFIQHLSAREVRRRQVPTVETIPTAFSGSTAFTSPPPTCAPRPKRMRACSEHPFPGSSEGRSSWPIWPSST